VLCFRGRPVQVVWWSCVREGGNFSGSYGVQVGRAYIYTLEALKYYLY